MHVRTLLFVATLIAWTGSLSAQVRSPILRDGAVLTERKISATQGGFSGSLSTLDFFGRAIASLGDLDGDGNVDLAVGAAGDDDGAPKAGAVWILFLDGTGQVRNEQKISATSGNFSGHLDGNDGFGRTLEPLGDLDGDGLCELAVGTVFDDDGGADNEAERGAVWILFLQPDGFVRSHVKISDTAGGFSGGLADGDEFGRALADLGDLDGDGTLDLAVGATGDAGLGGSERGAVWILFLQPDGTVRDHVRIGEASGGFAGQLDDMDRLGTSAEALGDFDGDGVVDLLVGAESDGDGGFRRGAVWILYLQEDGSVGRETKISSLAGGFRGALDDGDSFGYSVGTPGDLDGDGVVELAVGCRRDDDGGMDRGALWILFPRTDGTVRRHQKLSSLAGGFDGPLDDGDWFGTAFERLGDIDGDGIEEIAVGVRFDDDGGLDLGAVWLLGLARR